MAGVARDGHKGEFETPPRAAVLALNAQGSFYNSRMMTGFDVGRSASLPCDGLEVALHYVCSVGNLSHSTATVIGAGPYGLSIAAHLRSAGIDFRVFGKPMHPWRCHMPKGMFLKSEGCASSLSDPDAQCTLAQYCSEKGLPYHDRAKPVPIETFLEYGLSFQRKLVPMLEERMVVAIDRASKGFVLRLDDGEAFTAEKVVIATGIEHAAYVPDEIARLPRELASHSGDHDDLSRFRGREVIVVGAGQSALETAALLFEQGARVRLLARRREIAWNELPVTTRRSRFDQLRYPVSNLGGGFRLWLYSTRPPLFRHFPQSFRFREVRYVLGPSGAWWLKDRVLGRVQVVTGCTIQKAELRGGRVALQVQTGVGAEEITADHVIAATGYHFGVRRLPFLSGMLKSQIRALEQQPVLSTDLESSVTGLYFTGLASATSLGSAMRFVHGADFTARRVSCHIAVQLRAPRPKSSKRACTPKCGEF